MSSPSVQTLCAHSAFAAYVKAGPIAAFESSTGGHILHKRCFRFLISIQEKKGRAAQISGLNASASDYNNQHQKARTDSAFEHLIAERNRRTRLKVHFSNLYSLLPKKSKRDKYSILANTTSYLKELKLRVIQLEQQNQNLLKLVSKSFPKAEGSKKDSNGL
ncbi:transcription factor bHLH93 isoform X2 [Cryptomeria japonica]|uniref:transcription factor bHLH93 isoform X2 n=1 Tax=Cryptomeria japonica TaxID=3369 RepID=UPI0027DA15A4|nr:transcription factor bHLH93 isoform X2 [Cryptomeria japonica]